MKRFLRFAAYAVVFCCAIFGSQLQAHGFGESTLIKNSKVGWWNIGQIYRVPSSKKQKVLSYDMRTKRCVAATVKAAAESETNCYVKIDFDSSPNNEIRCTPIQEFYLPETKKWAPAYKLKIGDKLLSNCATPIAITNIEFVEKPLKIYALRIKKNHNYMVGRHNILTHNLTFAIPSLALTIFTTFGEGAAAGGTAGSWLGPIGCTLTAVAGGLIVTGGWLLFGNDRKRTSFNINFEADSFGDYFKNWRDTENTDSNTTNSSESMGGTTGGPDEPEDPRGPRNRKSFQASGPKDKDQKNNNADKNSRDSNDKCDNNNSQGNDSRDFDIKNLSDKTVNHPRFGKFFRDASTQLWWAKDRAGHGQSAWKVFKETAKGLDWFKDADKAVALSLSSKPRNITNFQGRYCLVWTEPRMKD